MRGRREEGRNCRCEALQSEAKQFEAIPYGMASITLPAYEIEIFYHNDMKYKVINTEKIYSIFLHELHGLHGEITLVLKLGI